MSPVSVGELNTEVTAEAAPAGAPGVAAHPEPWEELERVRAVARELASLRDRTHAEGFHV